MRTLGKTIVTFGALALLASPAWAQQGRGFGMGGGPGILMSSNVQKELKLSDEQIGKVQDVIREIFQKHQDELMALRDLPQEERPKKASELMKTMNDEAKKELALSSEQSHRLEQIRLQGMGLQAFMDPKVQEKVMLTDEQKARLRDLGEEQRERAQEIFQSAGDDREGAMKKFTSLRKEIQDKAMAVLTADQKKAWSDLTGKPVEINMPPFRRPNN